MRRLMVAVAFALVSQAAAVDCAEWNSRKFFRAAWAIEVRACLALGAWVNARNELDWTPLHSAAADTPDPTTIAVLLRAGAEVGARTENGWTPLHFSATHNDNPDVVRALLNAGAEVNARDWFESTPLHLAADRITANSAVIMALLGGGAEVNARTMSGWTPLHLAARPSSLLELPSFRLAAAADRPARVTAVVLLLANGAAVNARTGRGYTPLHLAAAVGYDPAIIEVLLGHGADASARDEEGNTPWDYVQDNEALKGTDAYWRLNEGRFR